MTATKPTGEELWRNYWTMQPGDAVEYGERCFDAGAAHAREEMAQKRGPRPENPYPENRPPSRCDPHGVWNECAAVYATWADSGAPEPAPASEELVERIARVACNALPGSRWEDDPDNDLLRDNFRGVARAVLAEIAPSDVIVHVAKTQFVDNESLRSTISTLEARVKELEGELSATQKAKRENDDRFMAERDQARAQLAARDEELAGYKTLLDDVDYIRELAALNERDYRAKASPPPGEQSGRLQRGVNSAAEWAKGQPQWKLDAAAEEFPIGAPDEGPPVASEPPHSMFIHAKPREVKGFPAAVGQVAAALPTSGADERVVDELMAKREVKETHLPGGHGPHYGEIAELRRRIKRFEDLVGMASLAFSRFDAEIQRERGGK